METSLSLDVESENRCSLAVDDSSSAVRKLGINGAFIFSDQTKEEIIPAKNPEDDFIRIVSMLEAAETAAPSIGVPWLLPTERIKQLGAQAFTPIDDFIRSSLVGISSNALELFCKELTEERNAQVALDKLGFTRLNFFERFGIPVIVAGAILTLAFLNFAIDPGGLFIKLSLVLLAACSLLAARSRNGFRRYSFLKIIEAELARRSGKELPGLSPIPFIACKTPN